MAMPQAAGHLRIHHERDAGDRLDIHALSVHIAQPRLNLRNPGMQWTSSGVLDDEKALPVLLDDARVIVRPFAFQKGHDFWSYQVIMHIDNAYHSPVPPL